MPNRRLLSLTKRFPSVMCISFDHWRRPTRTTSVMREAIRTASANHPRCSSCAAERRSLILRGYDRMHHLPRHW